MQRARLGAAEGSKGKDDFWQKLWKVDCPPKVRHFLWHLGHNTLALKKNLQRRGMKIDTNCCLCRRLDEEGGHLFLKCKEVRGIWRELNLEAVRCQLTESTSPKDMLEFVLKLEPKTQLTVILLLWLWWDERKKFREEGRRRPALEVAYVTAALADRFQAKGTQHPLPDYRDDQGLFVKAGAGREQFLQSAFHAELLGCLAGLKTAAQLGIRRVELETDASLVKAALDDDAYRLSTMSGIATETRLLLMAEFESANISVCPRSCNKVADAIAAVGCRCASDVPITWDFVPHFVEDLVTSDSAASDE